MAENLPEPESRKETFLAKAAGENVELPTPASREELFLKAIADNGGGGGGGTTYTAGDGIDITDDTISVDTTTIQPKLTAGSNVTISDNTISATDTTYNNFTGTDGNTGGTAGLVPAPATTDAGKFLKADGTWDTAGGGGGSVHTLTSADNNYDPLHTGTNTAVAGWLLPSGWYITSDNNGLANFFIADFSLAFPIVDSNSLVGVKISSDGTTASIIAINLESFSEMIYVAEVYTSTGLLVSEDSFTDFYFKGIKNDMDEIWSIIPLVYSGQPDQYTDGTLGQFYTDTDTMHTYQCTAIDDTDPDSPVYTWTQRW